MKVPLYWRAVDPQRPPVIFLAYEKSRSAEFKNVFGFFNNAETLIF